MDIRTNQLQLAQVMERIVHKIDAKPREELSEPDFSGEDHEDPVVFLAKLEKYFEARGKPYEEWAYDVGRYL